MAWWQPHKFEDKKPFLQARMAITRQIRAFFDDQGFWEVQTPVMQTMPGADVHIHAYRLENGQYLHNSPEFAMKKLLVAGGSKIYQIGPVFRKEERTCLHSPEFTMVEWYRAGAGYQEIMADCEALLRGLNVTKFRYNGRECDPHEPWLRLSVSAAFERYAGMDLAACLGDVPKFAAAAEQAGVRVIESDAWDDIFHAVMAAKIEPYLGDGAPCILYDYPAAMAALARKKPEDPRFAERFELYICGVELANGFGELADPAEQRARFEADMAEKERLYGERFPIDEDFLAALEHGMPESGGIALGVDRLVMLATDAKDISQVLWTEKP